jgi:hypothetical protein
MIYCQGYCIDVPDQFPVSELTRYMTSAREVLLKPTQSAAWGEFAGASNLIGWRFRASWEDWCKFKQSQSEFGDGGNHEELYRRERALFGMFSAGVSCVESVTYSLAALLSHPVVLGLAFGADEQRACSPKRLREWLRRGSGPPALISALECLIQSLEWKLWLDLRNRMTHRSNLSRRLFASIGSPAPATRPLNFAPTSSTDGVDAEISDFDNLHLWLATNVAALLRCGSELAERAAGASRPHR